VNNQVAGYLDSVFINWADVLNKYRNVRMRNNLGAFTETGPLSIAMTSDLSGSMTFSWCGSMLVGLWRHNGGSQRGPAAGWEFPTHSLPRAKMHVGLQVKRPLKLSNLNQNWNLFKTSNKTPQYLFFLQFVERFWSCYIRTDWQTDAAKIIGAFLQILLVNVTKNR
jgi:hypothetical protein